MDKKKILVTCTDVMLLQFLAKHVFYLRERGFEVDAACSDVEGHVGELKALFLDKVKLTVIDCVRSPFSPKNLRGYRQLKKLVDENDYDLIWTNEPVMGMLTRLAARKARKKGTKVIYVAHGFHFYKGAPLKMWLLFYPLERFAARFTDKLITINGEDFALAQKRFKRCAPERFNGIGIDTKKFARTGVDRSEKRKELGVPPDRFLFLSVGELEKRKNHDTVIRAFAAADIANSELLVCGVGTQKERLERLIEKRGVGDRVRLLGYRYDIRELLETADAFVLGSYQEGLSVAIMEAMAMRSLCVVSRIRGNVDLIKEGNGIFFDPKSVSSVQDALVRASRQTASFDDARTENEQIIKEYDSEIILAKMARTIVFLTRGDEE